MVTREWASLREIPVVPLVRGTRRRRSAEEQVRAVYPGRTDHLRIVILKRLEAAVLLPRVATGRESTLPVPAIALNRDSSKWRRAAGERLFHAANARGFDLYELDRRRLVRAWSSGTAPEGSLELTVPRGAGRFTVRSINRVGGLRGRTSTAITLVLLILAMILRVWADTLSRRDAIPPSEDYIVSPASTPRAETVPIDAVTDILAELHGSVPGFRLEALEASPNRALFRFVSRETAGDVLTALRKSPERRRNHTVEEVDGGVRGTVEVRYE